MKTQKKCETMQYVLVTPARNEQDYIEKTVQSVIRQTKKPLTYCIVSDGSTDDTDKIVEKYAKAFDWIVLIRMSDKRERSFSAKVDCFNAGYKELKNQDFDVVGNLDADISFSEDYMEFLISKFETQDDLGVAGTPFIEDGGYSSISDSFEGRKHVAGGCQLFRKACFDDIGGYKANKAGGIDWIAVTTARMKGWTTQSFPQKVFSHHRSLGTGESNKFYSNFKYGQKDYYLGNHPLWETFRILYQLTKKPYVIGGLTTLLGYLWASLSRMERPISEELMAFHRDEEIRKLKAIVWKIICFRKVNKYDLDS